ADVEFDQTHAVDGCPHVHTRVRHELQCSQVCWIDLIPFQMYLMVARGLTHIEVKGALDNRRRTGGLIRPRRRCHASNRNKGESHYCPGSVSTNLICIVPPGDVRLACSNSN